MKKRTQSHEIISKLAAKEGVTAEDVRAQIMLAISLGMGSEEPSSQAI